MVALAALWTLVETGVPQPLAGSALLLPSLTVLRHLIELLCAFYGACFLFAAIRYVRKRPEMPVANPPCDAPPVAIIYLCCNDLEEEALESLSRLHHSGRLIHIVHDDSVQEDERQRVDGAVRRLAERTGVVWEVMRRPGNDGGKPAALQYVLDQSAHRHEFFLLADNDSYATDRDLLRKAMPSFSEPHIGVVQFRNRARVKREDGPLAATVAGAVDIFDAFMTGLFDALWRPFVGHNALLRTRAVVEAGGFTPGFFADDIDLTVRLNLQGRRVAYRRDLSMEECHPSNYRSFCLRSRKWAHGCAQVLRAHLLSVLACRVMTAREKLGFLLFTGFYILQVAMLAYVVLVFLVLPLLIGASWRATWWAIAVGTVVPMSIFLPIVAYLRTEGRRLLFFRTLIACAATYGSTDLWVVRGLAGGFRKKASPWIPTNGVPERRRPWLDWGHFGVGTVLLLVPLGYQPELLLFPVTWLFAAKYLFVPAVAVHYVRVRDAARPVRIRAVRRAQTAAMWVGLVSSLGIFALPTDAYGETESPGPRIEVRDGQLLIDGQARILRGIHYSPWRPGTGPGRGFPYPRNDEIRADFEMLRALHANTILVYDAPARLLDLAHQYDLNVIYAFNIFWWRLPSGAAEEVTADIASRVAQLRKQPAVVAWMLGNEVDGWVIDAMKPQGVRKVLSDIRAQIRAIDPTHPVCHGNWPLTRTMDLDREMDLLCYNVYPFFPTEVVAAGYGRFIRNELKPLAAGRPLIITEFGVNTIEATPPEQANILRDCWRALLDAGAQGGVVFAFADEWWKNYDNPVRPPDWWRRADAPDDHLTDDAEPEERYGIVTVQRVAKPAYAAVQEMFKEAAMASPARSQRVRRVVSWIGGAVALVLITGALWLRWKAPKAAGTPK